MLREFWANVYTYIFIYTCVILCGTMSNIVERGRRETIPPFSFSRGDSSVGLREVESRWVAGEFCTLMRKER